MTRHWDLLPVTARKFLCVQEVWRPIPAICTFLYGAAFNLIGTPHSTGKGYCCGLATLVQGCLHEEFLFFKISYGRAKFMHHSRYRGVVLAWRVQYSPRLFPRQRASMRLLVESWKHASTRRRFWITW
ncbi:hypothetical protein TcG_10303 [Trypanosoma cruzi]|nr:hypothetical protein TcG_10303 [Trypanosoma cruzi]